MRERELKPGDAGGGEGIKQSLPMRERELKLRNAVGPGGLCASLPMRERELKLDRSRPTTLPNRRSPCGSVN